MSSPFRGLVRRAHQQQRRRTGVESSQWAYNGYRRGMSMNWRWIVAAALLLPFLIAFLFLQVITISFAKLGLSPSGALLVYLGSLLGGWFNIPVWRRPVARNVGTSVWPWAMASRRAWGGAPIPYRLFFYQPPVVQEQVIAINLGGAVIPLIMCAYLLPRVPLGSA